MATYDYLNRVGAGLGTRERAENMFFTAMSLVLLAISRGNIVSSAKNQDPKVLANHRLPNIPKTDLRPD